VSKFKAKEGKPVENELLISRIQVYSEIWNEHEKVAPGSYDKLMRNDDFWDPFLHPDFEQRRGWHKLGSA
jgi:hypothetical protein